MLHRHLAWLIAFVSLLAVSSATAQDAKTDRHESAPLGLTWGMSKADVLALEVELGAEEDGPFGIQAVARNVPRALADSEFIYLFFGFDDRLWRVFIASGEWDNDDYGIRAKKRFDELSALIDQKYGVGHSVIIQPIDDFYSTRERFAYSLSQNKRTHGRLWETDDLTIELALSAKHTDTYYTLAYEHSDLAKNAREGQKARDKGAL